MSKTRHEPFRYSEPFHMTANRVTDHHLELMGAGPYAVYSLILRRYNSTGTTLRQQTIYQNHANMARQCGMSPHTLEKNLRKLLFLNLIKRKKAPGSQRRKYLQWVYVPVLPPPPLTQHLRFAYGNFLAKQLSDNRRRHKELANLKNSYEFCLENGQVDVVPLCPEPENHDQSGGLGSAPPDTIPPQLRRLAGMAMTEALLRVHDLKTEALQGAEA